MGLSVAVFNCLLYTLHVKVTLRLCILNICDSHNSNMLIQLACERFASIFRWLTI